MTWVYFICFSSQCFAAVDFVDVKVIQNHFSFEVIRRYVINYSSLFNQLYFACFLDFGYCYLAYSSNKPCRCQLSCSASFVLLNDSATEASIVDLFRFDRWVSSHVKMHNEIASSNDQSHSMDYDCLSSWNFPFDYFFLSLNFHLLRYWNFRIERQHFPGLFSAFLIFRCFDFSSTQKSFDSLAHSESNYLWKSSFELLKTTRFWN